MEDEKLEITADMLKELQTELRELDLKWTEKLLAQILADKTGVDKSFRTDVTVRKIYNVFNYIVKDLDWIILMYGQGKKLRDTLKQEIQEKIKNVIE